MSLPRRFPCTADFVIGLVFYPRCGGATDLSKPLVQGAPWYPTRLSTVGMVLLLAEGCDP